MPQPAEEHPPEYHLVEHLLDEHHMHELHLEDHPCPLDPNPTQDEGQLESDEIHDKGLDGHEGHAHATRSSPDQSML